MVVGLVEHDVAVVGAGLSGLVAARRLEARGASVIVFEARDRVGGKLLTESLGGVPVDLGARSIGGEHERVIALAQDVGVATVPQYASGRSIHYFGGRRSTTRSVWPRVTPWYAEAAASVALLRIDRMIRRIPREHPWFAADAQSLDSMTLEDFKRRNVWTSGARAVVDLLARLLLGAEPREISFLFFLAHARSIGGLNRLLERPEGVRELAFDGGAQQLCEQLRTHLHGDTRVGEPVVAIEQEEDSVVVRSERMESRVRYVVIALSPALAGRIRYSPPLPAARDALSQQMPLGAGTKAVAVFERPWWREQGLSGFALADRGPVQLLVDESPADGSRGVLSALVAGYAARELGQLGVDERRRAVLSSVARLFGLNELVPLAYRDYSWDVDPWSRGMPTAHMGPGVMSALGSVLREPAGRIHWAGTETATEWTGFMEGAVEAGERVASEVLARIGEHRRRATA